MRGASALGEALAAHRDAPARVLVIWEPVLPTDRGPPTDEVRRPLQDPRVIEWWDADRWISPRALKRAETMGMEAGKEKVAWDFIALFPPGVVWEEPFPAPAWHGEPVVMSMEPVLAQLSGRAQPPAFEVEPVLDLAEAAEGVWTSGGKLPAPKPDHALFRVTTGTDPKKTDLADGLRVEKEMAIQVDGLKGKKIDARGQFEGTPVKLVQVVLTDGATTWVFEGRSSAERWAWYQAAYDKMIASFTRKP